MNVFDWIELHAGDGWVWYAKRLSGNDTQATAAHQAGPYIPKSVYFKLFPRVTASRERNPRASLPVTIDSHEQHRTVQAIWYNNKVVANGTRDETRITGWGGTESPLLDPDSTGSLCVFAFAQKTAQVDSHECHVWLCSTSEEEDSLEGVVGPVEPGRWILLHLGMGGVELRSESLPCVIGPDGVPEAWKSVFPRGEELVRETLSRRADLAGTSPDLRLMGRRDCEYELFRAIEEFHVLPEVKSGFGSVDSFIQYAHSVANRRKSRTGRSLELHAKAIFDEDGISYGYQEMTEPSKRPDFIFPSIEAYRDPSYPREKLFMLAAKTTCKERWTQILDEAAEIPTKHLLTVQEGLSEKQFKKMSDANVVLVVPSALHSKYPQSVRAGLLSVKGFIDRCRAASP